MKNATSLLGLAFLMITSIEANTVSAATMLLDEGAIAQTGTLDYDGEGGGLIGTDIIFTTILGAGTLANSGTWLICDDCKLNFTTGSNITEGPGEWSFGPGGTFELAGTVKTVGDAVVASGVLLTGSFTGAPNLAGGGEVGSDKGYGIFIGTGVAQKNADLLEYYGFAADVGFTFANNEISLGSCSHKVNAGFSCLVQNADLATVATVVPIPAAAWLFGSALLGLVGIARRGTAA